MVEENQMKKKKEDDKIMFMKSQEAKQKTYEDVIKRQYESRFKSLELQLNQKQNEISNLVKTSYDKERDFDTQLRLSQDDSRQL